MKKKIKYVEPVDYFPEEIRKKYKLGEYSEMNSQELKTNKKTKGVNKKEKDNEKE